MAAAQSVKAALNLLLEIEIMPEEAGKAFVDQVRAIAAEAAPARPEDELEALRLRVHAILTKELKYAEVDWHGERDLDFAVEEASYRFRFDPREPRYISIIGVAAGSFTDEASRLRALQAASATSHAVKVAKVVVLRMDDGVWIAGTSVEAVLPSFDIDKPFVRRLVILLRHAATEFSRRYAELADP
jgi:hypothetical protein